MQFRWFAVAVTAAVATSGAATQSPTPTHRLHRFGDRCAGAQPGPRAPAAVRAGAWAQGFDHAALGLSATEVNAVNDDRVGLSLDELFVADRASLLTALSLRVIESYEIALDELHVDSTSICLYGAYREAQGTARTGVTPPGLARGYSRVHRGDLLTLVYILTVSAEARCRSLAGLPTGTPRTRQHTSPPGNAAGGSPGRATISRSATRTGTAWIAKGPVPWTEISRRPGKRQVDPDEVHRSDGFSQW